MQRLWIRDDRICIIENQLLRGLAEALKTEAQTQHPAPPIDDGAPYALDWRGNMISISTRIQILTTMKVPSQMTTPQDECSVLIGITNYYVAMKADCGYIAPRPLTTC